mgnify:CR=1 FL=1
MDQIPELKLPPAAGGCSPAAATQKKGPLITWLENQPPEYSDDSEDDYPSD